MDAEQVTERPPEQQVCPHCQNLGYVYIGVIEWDDRTGEEREFQYPTRCRRCK
jgi:hypothetical protein